MHPNFSIRHKLLSFSGKWKQSKKRPLCSSVQLNGLNTHNSMWHDLRKPVTWCKIDILSYWYHVKVWITSSITFFLDHLWYWYQTLLMFKGYENKEKHKNYVVNFLSFAVSSFATCDEFSQITSHIVIHN